MLAQAVLLAFLYILNSQSLSCENSRLAFSYPSFILPFFSLTASLAQHHLLMALYDQPLDTVLRGLETRYLFFPPWNFLSEAEKETQ